MVRFIRGCSCIRSTSGVPQLFTAPFGGKLADRFGPARMILLGSLLIGVALLMLG